MVAEMVREDLKRTEGELLWKHRGYSVESYF